MFFSKSSSRSACLALAVALAAGVSAARADINVTVSPSSMGPWTAYTSDNNGDITAANSATTDFVTGPATPPLGTGSAHFLTGAGHGDESGQLRLNVGNLPIGLQTISELKYSTYATSDNGSQLPYLTLWVSNGTSIVDRIWFEPAYSNGGYGNGDPNPQPNVALNTWQQWDALNGMWYDDNGIADPTVFDHRVGPGADTVTFPVLITDLFNAYGGVPSLVNAPTTGGVRIATGFASASDNFDTNVDAFRLGVGGTTTQYNFEPDAVAPEPASLGLLGLGAVALLRRRKA